VSADRAPPAALSAPAPEVSAPVPEVAPPELADGDSVGRLCAHPQTARNAPSNRIIENLRI
jgi:hypothetical protein